MALLAERLADSGLPVVAVDLPSGVDADTGAVAGAAFRADLTVTFGVPKVCHLLEPARGRCGRSNCVDIGLDPRTPTAPGWLRLEDEDLAVGWPFPGAASDKYARGVVGLDAGSDQYPGAGVLSTYGAVHAGAGMVRFLGRRPARRAGPPPACPTSSSSPGRVQAHLLGSGWGDRPDGADVVAAALDTGLPAVLDADGLRFLPDRLPDELAAHPARRRAGRGCWTASAAGRGRPAARPSARPRRGPGRPSCSRAPPSSSPAPATEGRARGARSGLDGPGGIRRRPRRHLRAAAGRRAARAARRRLLGASVQALTAAPTRVRCRRTRWRSGCAETVGAARGARRERWAAAVTAPGSTRRRRARTSTSPPFRANVAALAAHVGARPR